MVRIFGHGANYNFYRLQNKAIHLLFSFLCQNIFKQNKVKKNLLLSVLGAYCLDFLGPLMVFLFCVLLILFLSRRRNQRRPAEEKSTSAFGTSYVGFLIWNLISTWWIYNSTAFGAAFAILCNSSFYAIILCLYRWSLTRLPKKTSLIFLVALWMTFEKFHLNWDFSWPWLNLGNVFSEDIYWIQWYEYTGAFGGTLWVLLVN